jgi:hypothetical protein
MSNTLTVTEVVNSVTVTPINNTVTVSGVGVQGPAGATGATGATGAQGPSGVVTVNAPLTNAGTSSAANLSISVGTTSAVGALQLTDSVASTSTTTAATPNAVKITYDALPNLTRRSGLYYRTPSLPYNAVTLSNNTLYLTPIFIDATTTIDRIGVRSSSSFSGTSTVRLGIYSNVSGAPSALVLDAGTVSFTGANQNQQITINQSLTPGFYWLAFCQQGTAPTLGQYLGVSESTSQTNLFMFVSQTIDGQLLSGFYVASITGAFPSTITPIINNRTPYVWIRVA